MLMHALSAMKRGQHVVDVLFERSNVPGIDDRGIDLLPRIQQVIHEDARNENRGRTLLRQSTMQSLPQALAAW